MLQFGWSPLVLLFSSPSVPVPIFWWLYWAHQLQLVSPSPSCSIFSFCSLVRSRYLSLFLLSFSFILWSVGVAKSTIQQVLFCWWLSQGLVVWPRLGDSFMSQNPREFWASQFPGRILGCVYIICSYGQTYTSCTIPNGSSYPPTCV